MGRCVAGKVLSQYMDGEVRPAVGRHVGRHVAECAQCAAALADLAAADEAVRGAAVRARMPDLAQRVTAELKRRGAFVGARIAHAKRRLVGERFVPGRMAAALALAAAVLVFAAAGLDHLGRRGWARQTAPVLADAERVLVRLVRVDPAGADEAMAAARLEARLLDLSARLAEARKGAGTALAADLADLERTFALLAGPGDLPADLERRLVGGEVRQRAGRLREILGGDL